MERKAYFARVVDTSGRNHAYTCSMCGNKVREPKVWALIKGDEVIAYFCDSCHNEIDPGG